MRREYSGKRQLKDWLQQLSVERTCVSFYKRRLTLDELLGADLREVFSELRPCDVQIIQHALDQLKRQARNNSQILTTIQYQSYRIDHIQISSQVAEGNFSVVFSGFWQKTVPVIIKRFKSSDLAIIHDEYNVLCFLKHPNIITCYGRAMVDGQESLIFEQGLGDYATLRTSDARLRESFVIRKKIVQDVCRAMIFLKNKKIVRTFFQPLSHQLIIGLGS